MLYHEYQKLSDPCSIPAREQTQLLKFREASDLFYIICTSLTPDPHSPFSNSPRVFHKNSLYKIFGANRVNKLQRIGKLRIPLGSNLATVACQNQRSEILHNKGSTFAAAHSEKISLVTLIASSSLSAQTRHFWVESLDCLNVKMSNS